MFTSSIEWHQAFPGALVGLLVIKNVSNPKSHPDLEKRKADLESRLRSRFPDVATIKSHYAVKAYKEYYKQFKKTYHVQQQIESIACKGKSIPKVAALVEAMFMAELDSLLLTACHDYDLVHGPVTINVSMGTETYLRLNGQEQSLKTGDMFISDTVGILSSIIYGPDKRTSINPTTTNVLFTTYAVPGISEHSLHEHLEGIISLVHLVSPKGKVDLVEILRAD